MIRYEKHCEIRPQMRVKRMQNYLLIKFIKKKLAPGYFSHHTSIAEMLVVAPPYYKRPGTVLATGSECIINIYVILGRRNLFEMGAVRSSRDQWRSQPDIWSCKCKFFCVYRPYKEPISE